MTLLVTDIATSITGGAGYFTWTRTADGTLYAVLYDGASSPTRGIGYSSDDSGSTWNAEAWSAEIGSPGAVNDGCGQPTVMSDPRGTIWVAMDELNGVDSPAVIARDPIREVWGGPGVYGIGWHQFSTKTGVTYLQAAMDSAHRTAAVWNIGCVFVHSGTLYFSDIASGDVAISATGTITTPKLAITGGGTKNVAWEEGGRLWGSQRIGLSGSWSSRVSLEKPGQVVAGCEAVTIQPNGQPSVIYLVDAGGGLQQLWMTEYSAATATWSQTEVFESARHGFFAGGGIGYDALGTVYVIAPYNVGGAGRAEVCEFNLPRGLSPTIATWTFIPRTALSGGDSAQATPLGADTPSLLGYTPNRPDRGMAYVAFEWPTGAASSAQNLRFWNPDDDSAPNSGYPTNLPRFGGEPPFRESPNVVGLPSVTLEGEGSPEFTFPAVEAEYGAVVVSPTFVVHTHTFQAGYRLRSLRLPNKRRVFDLGFMSLVDASIYGVREFIAARKKDRKTFDWTHPKTAEVIPVKVTSNRVRRTHVEGIPQSGSYRFDVQLQEVLA